VLLRRGAGRKRHCRWSNPLDDKQRGEHGIFSFRYARSAGDVIVK
jgi:hypothetical protein